MTALPAFVLPALSAVDDASTPCANGADCSLNGLCVSGACVCDAPWAGPRCGALQFAPTSPSAGRDLYPANDTAHNTWNGPMVGPVDGVYYLYLPLYQHPSSTPLYNPTQMLLGRATCRDGPFTYSMMAGVDVNFNPGALVYGEGAARRFTLWTSGHPGKIYESASPAGPFAEVPGGNTTGECGINPSPLFVGGKFYCTGSKGRTIMTADALGGPWTPHGEIAGAFGEDPFLFVDGRGGWHALFHAANGSQHLHCGASRVSAHAFSADSGRTWAALTGPAVEPYKPLVVWDDSPRPQTFSSFERPHLYFDASSGRPTHLAVAAPLDIGDAGCPKGEIGRQGCKAHRPPCPCCNCKYLAHTGTVLIALA